MILPWEGSILIGFELSKIYLLLAKLTIKKSDLPEIFNPKKDIFEVVPQLDQ